MVVYEALATAVTGFVVIVELRNSKSLKLSNFRIVFHWPIVIKLKLDRAFSIIYGPKDYDGKMKYLFEIFDNCVKFRNSVIQSNK